MRRSDVIVHCLSHSGCGLFETEIKQKIKEVFYCYYPYESYRQWDVEINDTMAYAFHDTYQGYSELHIFNLIQQLWDVH